MLILTITHLLKNAADALIDQGATKLAILLPDPKLMFHHHLLHGFMTAVRMAGVEYEVVDEVSLDTDGSDISDWIKNRLSKDDAPDGWIFPGDVSGLAGMAALQDCGLVLGRDAHIVVKQTSGIFDLVRPRVSSLREDLFAAGQMLAHQMVQRIEGVAASDLQHLQPANVSATRT